MDGIGYGLTAELTEQYLKRERPAPTSKIALNLTAIFTCIFLAGAHQALWEDYLNNAPQTAWLTTIKLTVNTPKPHAAKPDAAIKSPSTAQMKPAPSQTNQRKLLPPKKASSIALTTPQPSQIPTTPIPAQNSHEPIQPWSNVFDSQLRKKLQQSSSQYPQRESHPQIITYRNLDGSEEVQQGSRCFTVKQNDISPTGLQWSLPHHCKGQLTQSEHIARGLNQAMKARFPKEKPSP